MRRRSRLGQMTLLILMAFLVACAATKQASAPASTQKAARVKIRGGQTVDSISLLPVYVVRGLELFEKEGLDVEWTVSSGSVTVGQGVDTGSLHFAVEAPSTVLSLIDKGRPLVMVQNSQNGSTQMVIARTPVAKEIGLDIEMPLEQRLDLIKAYIQKKGSVKWAVSRPNSASDIYARRFVEQMGLTVGKEVQIVSSGGAGQIASAIDNGAVEFALLWPPNASMLLAKGSVQQLIRISKDIKELGNAPNEVVVVHRDLIKKDPELVRRIVKVMTQANEQVAKLSVDELTDLVSKYLPGSREELRLAVELVKPTVPVDGKFTTDGFNALIQDLINSDAVTKKLTLEQAATHDFLPK